MQQIAAKKQKKMAEEIQTQIGEQKSKYTTSVNTKGEIVTSKVTWFGYRVHLVVDAKYELPVAFKLTPSSNSENKEEKEILRLMHEEQLEKCKYIMANKGYDDTKIIEYLEGKGIAAIIDICNKRKDGEKTIQYKDTDIVYTLTVRFII